MWFIVALLIIIFLTTLDILLKILVNINVPYDSIHPIIGHFLTYTNIHNYGAGFNLLNRQWLILLCISTIAIVLAFIFLWQCRHDWRYSLAVSFALAGALGNLISRVIFRYVTDMIYVMFIHFPVFNLADCCLVVGLIIMVALILTNTKIRN